MFIITLFSVICLYIIEQCQIFVYIFRMPEPVMGPKQIKPEYLNRAKSPPKAEWEEIPEDSIPD